MTHLRRMAPRSFAVVLLHCGNTACAAAMAVRVSSAFILGTVATTLPVAGLSTCARMPRVDERVVDVAVCAEAQQHMLCCMGEMQTYQKQPCQLLCLSERQMLLKWLLKKHSGLYLGLAYFACLASALQPVRVAEPDGSAYVICCSI